MRPEDCRRIALQTRWSDARGGLAIAEVGRELPFTVLRSYLLYRIPAGAERGRHGHRRLEQLFVAVHGRFRLTVDDGAERASFVLDRPEDAVYVGPVMWRELDDFSPDAACLVLVSHAYDAADYIHDYEAFRAVRRGRG